MLRLKTREFLVSVDFGYDWYTKLATFVYSQRNAQQKRLSYDILNTGWIWILVFLCTSFTLPTIQITNNFIFIMWYFKTRFPFRNGFINAGQLSSIQGRKCLHLNSKRNSKKCFELFQLISPLYHSCYLFNVYTNNRCYNIWNGGNIRLASLGA